MIDASARPMPVGVVALVTLDIIDAQPPGAWATVAPGVQRLPNGKFRARLPTASGRKTVGTFVTMDEAVRVRAAALVELASGNLVAIGGTTLRAWLVEFLKRREAARLRNIKTDRNRAKKHLLTAAFVDWPLRSLQRRHVLSWVRDLQAKRVDIDGQRRGHAKPGTTPKRKRLAEAGFLSEQTVRHCLNLLRRALAEAVDDGLIEANPALEVKPRAASTRTTDAWTTLSLEEQTALLKVVPAPERHLVAVAIGTGLRQGEMWGLEKDDVHLDAAVPYVVVRYGAPRRRPTKSGKPRNVPLVGPALEGMREWMAQLDTWCLRPGEAVFPLRGGNPRSKKPPRHFSAWLRKAGIKRHVRWHDLRHTAASSLVSGAWGRKWSMEEVREVLGHADLSTTQRYSHFAENVVFDAARAANSFSQRSDQ